MPLCFIASNRFLHVSLYARQGKQHSASAHLHHTLIVTGARIFHYSEKNISKEIRHNNDKYDEMMLSNIWCTRTARRAANGSLANFGNGFPTNYAWIGATKRRQLLPLLSFYACSPNTRSLTLCLSTCVALSTNDLRMLHASKFRRIWQIYGQHITQLSCVTNFGCLEWRGLVRCSNFSTK